MSGPVTVPFSWQEIDVRLRCRNWTQDDTGAQREKGNEGQVISALAKRFNYVAGKMPRTAFTKLVPDADMPVHEAGFDPIFRWYVTREINNAHRYGVRLVTSVKDEGDSTDTANVWRYGSTEASGSHNAFAVSSANLWVESWLGSYSSNAVNAAAGWAEDGISTSGGYKIHSITVQDLAQTELKTENGDLLAHYGKAVKTTPVLADAIEELRVAVNRFRTTNLPRVFQWCSIGEGTPATSDETAIVVDGEKTDFVNLFDQSVNCRTADSPGSLFYAFRSGVGREDVPEGRKVPVSIGVRALANVDVNVLFVGPEHIVPNSVNILVSNSSSADWYWATAHVYGNPLAHENTVSVNRNKIDAFVPEQPADGRVYIYNIEAWVNDPLSVIT